MVLIDNIKILLNSLTIKTQTMRNILTLLFMISTFCGFSQKVIQAEYFWDNDPGQGSATAMTAFDGNFNQAIETTLINNASLPTPGNHTIGIRVKGQDGNWSPVFKKVIRVAANTNTNNLIKITQAEYFWDNDPGNGNGNTMLAFDGNFANALESVVNSNTALPPVGNHTIGIRVKGDDGNWGATYRRVFKVAENQNTNSLVKITQAEYFWDDDPGQGAGNTMLVFDGNFNQAMESVMSSGASLPDEGNHTIGIRVKGSDGNWGSVYRKVFRLTSNNNTNNLVKITQAEYFWNADPGQGNGIVMLAYDSNFNQAIETVVANNAVLPSPGLNLLNVRVKANDGSWGTVYSKVVGLDIAYNSKVILTLPANGAINVPLTSSFVWEQLTGAGTYEYQCATDNTFTNIVQSGILSGLTVPFSSLIDNTTYYWRVRANVSGNVSLWSVIWSFTTDEALSTPNFENNSKILLVPNPSTDFVIIKLKNTSDRFSYKIYSIDGKKLMEGNASQGEKIETGSLASGTYFFEIKQSNEISKIKFLKK